MSRIGVRERFFLNAVRSESPTAATERFVHLLEEEWNGKVVLFLANHNTSNFVSWRSGKFERQVLDNELARMTDDVYQIDARNLLFAVAAGQAKVAGYLLIETRFPLGSQKKQSLTRATLAVLPTLSLHLDRLQLFQPLGLSELLALKREAMSFTDLLDQYLRTIANSCGFPIAAIYRRHMRKGQFFKVAQVNASHFQTKVPRAQILEKALERALRSGGRTLIFPYIGRFSENTVFSSYTSVFVPVLIDGFRGCFLFATELPSQISVADRSTLELSVGLATGILSSYLEESQKRNEDMSMARRTAIHSVDTLAQSARHKVRIEVDAVKATAENIRFPEEVATEESRLQIWKDIRDSSNEMIHALDEMANAAKNTDGSSGTRSFKFMIRRAFRSESRRADRLKVSFEVDVKDFRLTCYPTLLEHALFHLFQNALDAFERNQRAKGRRRLSVTMTVAPQMLKQTGNVTFHVVDNAGGLSATPIFDVSGELVPDVNRVFDAGTSSMHFRDSLVGVRGLGLSIVRNYILQHEGSIVVSQNATGTRFSITLPMSVNRPEIRMEGRRR